VSDTARPLSTTTTTTTTTTIVVVIFELTFFDSEGDAGHFEFKCTVRQESVAVGSTYSV
jgi:hypothetical protein